MGQGREKETAWAVRPIPLILASASPRRQEILRKAGLVFEIQDPGEAEEEVNLDLPPEELAIAKAKAKAWRVRQTLAPDRRALIAAADTIVAATGGIVGKPKDRQDARRILASLAASRHRVITGVCLWLAPNPLPPILFAETTWVTMRALEREEIDAYVESGEADGKAGAYAIQEKGDRFIERIEGSFFNVVGFPLEEFLRRFPRDTFLPSLATSDGLSERPERF